ncbi:MAG TPA: HNH endonuclease [bacterium]|nr:HNH endonuclease [bacterium]
MADVNKKSIVAKERWKNKKYRNMMMKVLKKNWENLKGNQINKGRKLTEEHKIKIRSYRHTEEAKSKIRGRRPANYIDGRSKLVGPGRYGDDWFKIRMLVYARDKFACQDCGITMNEYGRVLDVHHKIPFLVSFDNSLKNLITLCRPCHMRIEKNLIKKQQVEV